MASSSEQQHPISLYLKIWGLLFVLSFFSYMVDYLQFEGYARWSLILLFMFLKAGFIIAIFMHVAWERLSLQLVLFIPPLAIVVLITMMAFEADHTYLTRLLFFID